MVLVEPSETPFSFYLISFRHLVWIVTLSSGSPLAWSPWQALEQGLSVREAARAVGVSATTVQKIKNALVQLT